MWSVFFYFYRRSLQSIPVDLACPHGPSIFFPMKLSQDMREGSGSYFYAESGKVFVGEWVNDLPKVDGSALHGRPVYVVSWCLCGNVMVLLWFWECLGYVVVSICLTITTWNQPNWLSDQIYKMSISCCAVIQHWSTSTNMYEPFEWPWINHYQNHQNETLSTNNSSTTINQPFSTFLNHFNPFRPLPRFPPRPSCSSPQQGGGLHAGELQSGASHVGLCPGNATGESPGCPGQNKVGTYWINLAYYHTCYIILSNYNLSII